MKVTISKHGRYLVTIEDAPVQTIDVLSWLDTEGKTVTTARSMFHLERGDLESLILQLSGQLAKLDQDAETTKVVAK